MQVLFFIIPYQETGTRGNGFFPASKDTLLTFRKALFKNLQHGAPDPYLRLLQIEDTGDGGGTVKLHHAFIEPTSFLYVLS